MIFTPNIVSIEHITSYLSVYKPTANGNLQLKVERLNLFGEPVPEEGQNGVTHCVQSNDPTEKFIPSLLENFAKRNHGIPFTPIAQAALNVGKLIKCSECRKPRLIYAKKNLFPQNLLSLKRVLNDFQYVCGTILQDVPKDDRNPDSQITKLVFCKENFSCCSPVEMPYLSRKIHPLICVHCGRSSALLPNTPEFFPQWKRCETKARIKKNKAKTTCRVGSIK